MPPPNSDHGRAANPTRAWQTLRTELDALADALVDASPPDLARLRARVRHAEDVYHRCGRGQDEIARLLRFMMADLSADSLDTLYYARRLIIEADRLPN